MNMTEIERALRELRLSGIADTLSTRVMQAHSAQQPFLETLAAMLQDELDRRRSRLMERRFKRSGLAERLTLADFDWRFNPKLPRNACFELHTLKLLSEGANALIIGNAVGLPQNKCRKPMVVHVPLGVADIEQARGLGVANDIVQCVLDVGSITAAPWHVAGRHKRQGTDTDR